METFHFEKTQKMRRSVKTLHMHANMQAAYHTVTVVYRQNTRKMMHIIKDCTAVLRIIQSKEQRNKISQPI